MVEFCLEQNYLANLIDGIIYVIDEQMVVDDGPNVIALIVITRYRNDCDCIFSCHVGSVNHIHRIAIVASSSPVIGDKLCIGFHKLGSTEDDDITNGRNDLG